MKRFLLFALICLLAVLVAACRQEQVTSTEDVQIDVSIVDDQLSVGEATLQIKVSDKDSQPINDAKVNVRGDMSHAGMVPVLRDVSSATDGVYEVPFEWTMAGDWSVEVTVTLANGGIAKQTFKYSIASDGTMGDMNMQSTSGTSDMGDMNMQAASGTADTGNMDMGDMNMGETSAAYLSITNNSDTVQTLVGASSPVANLVEIHETSIVNDVARMTPVDSISIEPGATVELMPAGKHIMLMNLTQNLVIGDEVKLTLTFGSGKDITVSATVQDMLMDEIGETVEADGLSISNVWMRPATADASKMDMQAVSGTMDSMSMDSTPESDE